MCARVFGGTKNKNKWKPQILWVFNMLAHKTEISIQKPSQYREEYKHVTSSTSSNCQTCKYWNNYVIVQQQNSVKHHDTNSLLFHRECVCMENNVSKSPHYSNLNKIFNDKILETSSAQCHLWHCASSFSSSLGILIVWLHHGKNVGSEQLHNSFAVSTLAFGAPS